MKRQSWLAGMIVAALLAGVANGQGVALTAKVGTLGLGADLTAGAGDYLNMRVGINGFNYDTDRKQDEGVIKANFDWQTFAGLIDFHPVASGFRISGGVMINNNEVALSATPNDTIELNGVDFQLKSLDGKITFDDWAPYAGIGYGNAVAAGGRWNFACDFGVMFQGKPSAKATAVSAVPALQPAVNAALDHEVKKIEDDMSAFNIYPVISVGLSFMF